MKSRQSQSGAILFISLVMLVLLTILGLSSMQNSVMQEKMTAAVRDGRVALEGAEAALFHVEENVLGRIATTGNFNNNGCLYTEAGSPEQSSNGAWVPADLWTTTKSCVVENVNARATDQVGGSDGSLAEQPRYFIVLAGSLENTNTGSIEQGQYGDANSTGTIKGFKIVTRSVGSSNTSQKFILSYFGKTI